MFSRKKCPGCGEKLSKDYRFCPYCGYNIRKEQEEKDFGLLGRTDDTDFSAGMGMPFGLNKIFSSLMKQLDRQFQELDKEIGKEAKEAKSMKNLPTLKSKGISISISTSTGKEPQIRIAGFGPGFENLQVKEAEKPIRHLRTEISGEKAEKLFKLPKQEAETSVRRFSNKIVYEINLPGVKTLSNVIINQLENSIEIKAFSKDKAYFKLLPIKLPILDYKLENEKLILELKS